MRRLTYTDSYGNATVLGNPASGKARFVITSLVGFDSAPVSRFTQKAPYQDGDTHIDSLMNERTITVEGAIYKSNNLTNIFTERRALAQGFNPKSGVGTLLYEYDGGNSKTVKCALDQGPVFPNKLATEPFQRFQITFIANDPWLYGAPVTVSPTGDHDWKIRTMSVGGTLWNSVVYGNGVFVSIAYSGTSAQTSPDGIVWTFHAFPAGTTWYSLAYGAGLFVALLDGSTTVATSPDGVTWTTHSTLPSASHWSSLTFGNGVFVAVAAGPSTVAATSPDGITWTAQTLPTSSVWQAIAYGNGVFVATANVSANVAVSADGVLWSLYAMPVSGYWSSITFGAGIFVSLDYNSSIAASSPDGVTWTQRVLPGSANWIAVAFGAGVFMGVALGGTISASSADGVTWTSRTLPSSGTWYSIAFGASIFVAVSRSGSGATFFSAQSIAIAGDYSTPPLITINGPVTNPSVLNGNQSIIMNITLVTGESLIIDCNSAAPSITYVTIAGVKINALKYMSLTSILFQLYKGVNQVTFLANSISLVYSERYAGV